MKRLLALAIVVVLPAIAAAQEPAPAPAPAPASVAGAWDFSANIAGTAVAMKCTITQKGADLAGTCAADQGALTITGKVDGKTVSWQYDTVYEGQTLTVVHTGTLETPEKIVGTLDVRPMNVSGDFTAMKSK